MDRVQEFIDERRSELPTGHLGQLKFSGAELNELFASVAEATEFREPFSKDIIKDKGVWVVKDIGVYLMNAHKLEKKIIVFAEGLDPGDDQVDTAEFMGLMEGDDDACFLDFGDNEIAALSTEGAELLLEADGDEWKVRIKYLKRVKSAP